MASGCKKWLQKNLRKINELVIAPLTKKTHTNELFKILFLLNCEKNNLRKFLKWPHSWWQLCIDFFFSIVFKNINRTKWSRLTIVERRCGDKLARLKLLIKSRLNVATGQLTELISMLRRRWKLNFAGMFFDLKKNLQISTKFKSRSNPLCGKPTSSFKRVKKIFNKFFSNYFWCYNLRNFAINKK